MTLMMLYLTKKLAVPTVSLDSGLYLDRPFELSGYNFIQTLEPRVFYTYTPYEDQSELPCLTPL
jgi:LPS-assembly protein